MSKQTDFIEKARTILTGAGILYEPLDCSGEMAYRGTTRKPHGTDGRYKMHMDFPPTLWLCNYHEGGEGQTFKLYEKAELDAMSEADKKALRERIRQEKEAGQRRREERAQEAAREAKEIFSGLPLAMQDNAYLSRKCVIPMGDMRACDASVTPFHAALSGECLVLPVLNGEGETVSLQFIAGDGEKRFLSGGEKKGCYYPIPAKDGGKAGPLLIGEGVATVLSCCMATGYEGLVAFDANNLPPVAEVARQKYAEREIVVCADNDLNNKKPDGSPENPGKEKAEKAAQAVGAKLALCPSVGGENTDFNDLHVAEGLERVRECIEKARAEAEQPSFPAGYFVRESGPKAGLYKLEEVGEDVKEYRLGPPLRVLGRTRDENSKNWGILLEWKDPAGVQHRVALPDELRQKQGRDWASMLAADGYSVEPGQHNRFLSFLSGVKTARFITNTSKVGWYQTCFVLPDVSIGAEDGLVVLQSLDSMAGLYQTGGTLEGWQEMAALCVGNPRFTFALCAAFAGPLLKLAGMEGGGFSFEGPSSCGKTTCLQVAASVWGSPAHVRTWRTTSNGLESVAALHNDSLLVLDEVGQTTGKDLSEISYMLANGSGKTRAGRSGGARACTSWRLLFLSSGELGFADKLGEDGIRSRAGQEVRFVGIPVDSRAVVNLHSLPHAGALVNRIKELSGKDYGHASRAFLGWLVRNLEEVRDLLPETLPAFVADLCPDEAGEQVRRVAQRFAIVQIAGGLAQKARVLPVDMDVAGAVRSCFSAWLEQRGSVGASEDEAILAAVRLFLEQHGQSRFQDIEKPDAVCVNRAGFRRKDGERTEFLILPESFKEVVQGYALKRAKEALRIAEWMKPGERGKFTVKTSLPGLGRTHCYIVAIPDED